MRIGIVSNKSLLNRMDVNFHLSDSAKIEEYWIIDELKDTLVRDPNCYGFNYSRIGIPIIRISDLKNPFIDYSDVAFISKEIHENYKKTQLKKYDILMSVRGVSIGKIGIFLGEFEEANISPNVIIIRLKDVRLAPYVAMVLVSSIGQNQIKQIIAGSSKPTINASFINNIKIPKPSKSLLEQINLLFTNAEIARLNSKELLKDVEDIFNSEFGKVNEQKETVYQINSSKLGFRWDPHYHNPAFQSLRNKVSNFQDTVPLSEELDNVKTTYKADSSEKIGYIQITNVNNQTGTIDSYMKDYVKKLPSGGKIELKNGDILVSKVRPYRNAITMYRGDDIEVMTASKNAFSVYRTVNYYFPFYILAFLKQSIGINQIIMKQSGTSYPTVSEEEINETVVLLMDEKKMELINKKYEEYFNVKEVQENNRTAILDLLEESADSI
jgi:Type I restriction modification DNA specificity domain.